MVITLWLIIKIPRQNMNVIFTSGISLLCSIQALNDPLRKQSRHYQQAAILSKEWKWQRKKRFREHVQWWALFCKGLAKLKFILLVLCFLSANWNDWNQEMVTGVLKRMEYRVVQSSSALVIKWSNYLKIFMSFLKLILKACWFNINIWRGWQGLAVKHLELSVVLYAHYLYLYTKNGRGCDEICVSGFLKSCLVPRLKPYDCRRGIFSFFLWRAQLSSNTVKCCCKLYSNNCRVTSHSRYLLMCSCKSQMQWTFSC